MTHLTHARKRTFAAAFALSASAFCITAGAQQAEPTLEQRREAGMAFSRAQALRAGGQHEQAASLYETADRLAPSVQALGNAIREHRELHNPAHELRAANLSLRLLARYGNDPRFAEFANRVILETSPQLARIAVSCDGCTVEADGALQSDNEFFVLPGAHTLVAHWSNQREREHRLSNARAGTSENITLAPVVAAIPRTTANVVAANSTTNRNSTNTTVAANANTTSNTSTASSAQHVDTERPGAVNVHGGAVTDPSHTASSGASSGTTSGAGTASTGETGNVGGEGFGNGLVQPPPPSRGGIHPAIFLTTLALTLGAGGALTWSALDANAGVPAYQSAAAMSADSQDAYNVAAMLLADGQSRELRTNVLIGVTSGLGAIAVGTLIFTRWNRSERAAAPTTTVMLMPTPGSLPNLTLYGTF
jgi:hypothetical protein